MKAPNKKYNASIFQMCSLAALRYSYSLLASYLMAVTTKMVRCPGCDCVSHVCKFPCLWVLNCVASVSEPCRRLCVVWQKFKNASWPPSLIFIVVDKTCWPWLRHLKGPFSAGLAPRVARRNPKRSRYPITLYYRKRCRRRRVETRMPSCLILAPTTTSRRCGSVVLCKSSNSHSSNPSVLLIRPKQAWVFERNESRFRWIKLVRR